MEGFAIMRFSLARVIAAAPAPSQQPPPRSSEDAIDAAMANMSGRLIRKLADRVSCDEAGNRATLHLLFDH